MFFWYNIIIQNNIVVYTCTRTRANETDDATRTEGERLRAVIAASVLESVYENGWRFHHASILAENYLFLEQIVLIARL